jgi:hypothetical protein
MVMIREVPIRGLTVADVDHVVAVVGSVDITDAQLKWAEHYIHMIISYEGALTGDGNLGLVSGGAKGIDLLAESCAETFRIPSKIFEPSQRRWAPNGFMERNIEIVKACHVLYRLSTEQSKTFGSGWTYNYAKSLGKTVYPIVLPKHGAE